jgi:hypothetical protein
MSLHCGRPSVVPIMRATAWVVFLLALSACSAAAQDNTGEIKAKVNYVYASEFGFGYYEVGGLNVSVYTLPIAFTFPKAVHSWDLRLALPITYGRYHFSTHFESEGQSPPVRTRTAWFCSRGSP